VREAGRPRSERRGRGAGAVAYLRVQGHQGLFEELNVQFGADAERWTAQLLSGEPLEVLPRLVASLGKLRTEHVQKGLVDADEPLPNLIGATLPQRICGEELFLGVDIGQVTEARNKLSSAKTYREDDLLRWAVLRDET
jgi:hypothetical protein